MTKIRPDEITSIIREQIEKYDQVVKAHNGEKEFNHGYPYSYGDEGPDHLDYMSMLRVIAFFGIICDLGSPNNVYAFAGGCLGEGNKYLKKGYITIAIIRYFIEVAVLCGNRVARLLVI